MKFWSAQHEVKKGLNSGGGNGKSNKRTNMEDLLSLIPQMFFEFLVSGSGELTKQDEPAKEWSQRREGIITRKSKI